MGIKWSDVLYPDNPRRRDEVNKLAQSIRLSLTKIYEHVRIVSLSLHEVYSKFMVLDPMNLDLTYQQNFDKIHKVMDNWKATTVSLKLNQNIPDKIKKLMAKFDQATSVGELPDIVNDIVSKSSVVGNIVGSVVGLIAGSVATYYVGLSLGVALSSVVAATAAAGLIGAVVGVGIAVMVEIIIGAIEGAHEREELERRIREYSALDESLHNHLNTLEKQLSSVQSAIIRAVDVN